MELYRTNTASQQPITTQPCDVGYILLTYTLGGALRENEEEAGWRTPIGVGCIIHYSHGRWFHFLHIRKS